MERAPWTNSHVFRLMTTGGGLRAAWRIRNTIVNALACLFTVDGRISTSGTGARYRYRCAVKCCQR